MANISSYFERYGWACEEIEPDVWRSTFASEREEDFDLYVLVAEDWVHFAVSPFLPPFEQEAQVTRDRLYVTLLRLNQEMRLVRFAMDADGDVNLLADLPLARISYGTFAQALDVLVYYAGRLAHDLRRIAVEPGYHSPLFD